MKKALSFVLILFLTLSVLAAYTLEDFYTQPSVKKQVDADIKELNSKYKTVHVSWDVKDNTLIYTYRYETWTAPTTSLFLKTIFIFKKSEIESAKSLIREESDIQDVHLRYICYTKRGKKIYDHTW